MSDKKIIVLDHGGGRLANQLWNDAAILAYALEKGYRFESWASFEYHDYFDIPPIKNWFVRLAFFNPLVIKIKNSSWRKWAVRKFLKKLIFAWFAWLVDKLVAPSVLSARSGEGGFFLPPSKIKNEKDLALLHLAENADQNIYFSGWIFRNPDGLKKYREKIVSYFHPKEEIRNRVLKFIAPIKEKYAHVVGVHFRQGDFRTVPGHYIWRFTEEEVRKILDEYLKYSKKDKKETVFMVCSDEDFKQEVFSGLNIIKGPGNEIEDLLVLASAETVIGSKSTYGDFAAYYGNIPFIVFEREGVDWDYYKGKTEYFENKKSMLNSASPA